MALSLSAHETFSTLLSTSLSGRVYGTICTDALCTSHYRRQLAASVAGPETRTSQDQGAERYAWQPKEMLAQIASIYIHLGCADGQTLFAN